MAANLPDFSNVSRLQINISRIGTGNEVPENIKNYTRDNILSWLDITSFALFASLLVYFILVKQYDVYKSTLISSIATFIVSFSFLVGGFSKTITPLITYGTLILISSIAVYINKKKGF